MQHKSNSGTKMKWCSILVFVFFASNLFAQDSREDLEKMLLQKEGLEKIHILNRLIEISKKDAPAKTLELVMICSLASFQSPSRLRSIQASSLPGSDAVMDKVAAVDSSVRLLVINDVISVNPSSSSDWFPDPIPRWYFIFIKFCK